MAWLRAFKSGTTLPLEWSVSGCELIDCVEEPVAPVFDLLCEEETGKIRYLIIELGGFLGITGRRVMLPLDLLKRAGMGQVVSNCTLKEIQDAPIADDHENPSMGEELEVFAHFGIKPYWERVGEKSVGRKMKTKKKTEEPTAKLELERDGY